MNRERLQSFLLDVLTRVIVNSSKPTPFCHPCWEAKGRKPDALLFLGREPSYQCRRCGSRFPEREVVWCRE